MVKQNLLHYTQTDLAKGEIKVEKRKFRITQSYEAGAHAALNGKKRESTTGGGFLHLKWCQGYDHQTRYMQEAHDDEHMRGPTPKWGHDEW